MSAHAILINGAKYSARRRAIASRLYAIFSNLLAMGSNPYREKSPNRGMGREMGKDDEEPRDVNTQEIENDPRSTPSGQGTNFDHTRKKK